MNTTPEPLLQPRRWRRPKRLGLRILLTLPIWLVALLIGLMLVSQATYATDRLSWDKTEGVVANRIVVQRVFGGYRDALSVEYLGFTSHPDRSGFMDFWDPTVTTERSNLATGSRVTVYYDPGDPEDFTIVGHASRFLSIGRWALGLVSLVGLLLLLVGWKPLVVNREQRPSHPTS